MKMKATIAASLVSLALSATQPALADKGDMRKMGDALTAMYQQSVTLAAAKGVPSNAALDDTALGLQADDGQSLYLGPVSGGMVTIDAVAARSTDELVATIRQMGGKNVSSYGSTVSGVFPVARLAELASSSSLAFARPSLVSTDSEFVINQAGLVLNQADRSMRTDEAKDDLSIDGFETLVGVLSDSFSCATNNGTNPFTTTEEDIAAGEIPSEIIILDDLTPDPDPADEGCIDEGRAMAQLITDIAPRTSIAFHTAFNGQADFAQGIIELAEIGSDVIVDDVIFFSEPMFQDGIIAQAADEVNRLGVPYYSSNGNRGRDALQTEYRPVAFQGSTFHDFDSGEGEDPIMTVTLDGALQTNLAFNWDSPNFSISGGAGAPNDVAVVMFDAQNNRVPNCFPNGGAFEFPAGGLCQFDLTSGGVGGDAVEVVSLVDFNGNSTVGIGFETQVGDPASFVKFVIFAGNLNNPEYPIDSPSGFGHNNAAGAEGVAASAFFINEEFIDDPQALDIRGAQGPCIPACLNDFSSAGGTPIFFDVAGNRLPAPEVRLKPGITGPDGTNTSFFGADSAADDDDGDGTFAGSEPGEFPNFFGTSAAAPHIAAVAALMIDAEDSQIRKADNDSFLIQMCRLEDDGDDDDGDGILDRNDGNTFDVRPENVRARINEGFLLGACDRSEPAVVYNAMRSTAQDMSIRVSFAGGATTQVFDEVGPSGFDFDSGFGFIDAVDALEVFLNGPIDEDDDD
jgi:hypothetical protein